MTKKYYVALVDYIVDTENYCEPFSNKQIRHLMSFLKFENLRFDPDKFADAIDKLRIERFKAQGGKVNA